MSDVRVDTKPVSETSAAPDADEVTPVSSRRQALIILEVLAGTRSAPGAAELLGVSVNRYYQLEERGIDGMVRGLEPRPRGRFVIGARRSNDLSERSVNFTRSAHATRRWSALPGSRSGSTRTTRSGDRRAPVTAIAGQRCVLSVQLIV